MSSLTITAEELIRKTAANGQHPDTVQQELDDQDDAYVHLKLRLPPGVDVRDAIDFGFYEYKHRYWMRKSEDMFIPVSNFTMKVLYLIVGANPKRIVEITNVHGKRTTIDFSIEDLISIEKYKARVESQGNFLFEGNASNLARVKNKLYTLERPSVEISRLGQYKDKFWAWANGIYDGQNFLPIDDKGMVDCGAEHYYIPVFGATRADDDEDLRNYRRFLHRYNPEAESAQVAKPGAISPPHGGAGGGGGATTFRTWSTQFCRVYGDNARIGLAFFFFAIFSDIIFERTKAAPMLFLFGQRGSGKGTMANSLMSLFGYAQDPLMLGGASTVVGFMRKLGQFSNAIVWLDEYKNDIGERKIESLKNIWDRVGYERGVKDSTNKTQTTPVTSSAIISGQEIPNVEPALFSRTVLCEFRAMHRSQQEVDDFNLLRRMEDDGITNVTLEILTHRPAIKEHFFKSYAEISATMRAAFGEEDIIERQIINYSILAATVQVLEQKLPMPFTSAELLVLCEKHIKRQRDMMKQSNEVQQFFEMVAFLLAIGEITDGRDIHIFEGLVKIRMVAVVPLYREYSRRQGNRPMDKGTLLNYLYNSDAYCEKESKQSSHRFPSLQNPTSCTVFLQHDLQKLYGVEFNETLKAAENEPDTPETPDDPPY